MKDGTVCDDGLACTTADSCKGGICVGTTTCPASDQCHDLGLCTLKGCTNPPKTDGSTCVDGDACTQLDTCQAGVCQGAKPILCVAVDQCHDPGQCDRGTGMCSAGAPKADNTPCTDGSFCTRTDTCQGGVCKGADAIVCMAFDQCHSAGMCDPQSGMCSNPVKAGSMCNDSELCTYEDTCGADGACKGKPITCTSDDVATRTCNGTSTCDVMPKPGAACDDGNPCTKGDVRQANGSCAGMPYSCPVTACLVSSACDGKGGCQPVAKPDGTSCDADKSKCTPEDVCQGGVCVADPKPVKCVTKDCNSVVCDPATGNCEYTALSGGMCGLTGCYTMGMCDNGVCSGKPKDCSALDSPCTQGICDVMSGDCMSAPKPNGSSCTAGGKCGGGAVCAFGVCELAPQTCPAPTGPCKVVACVPESGACAETNRPAGAHCDPKSSCMSGATCDAQGNCAGAPAPNGQPCTGVGGRIGVCAVGSCVVSEEPSQPGPGGGADASVGNPPSAPDAGEMAGEKKSGSGGCGIALSPEVPPVALAFVLVALVALPLRRRRDF